MDRATLYGTLNRIRESKKISKYKLCQRMNTAFGNHQRFEKANQNIKMEVVFRFIAAIEAKLVIVKAEQRFCFSDVESLHAWIINVRKESGVLIKDIADKTGLSRCSVSNIEHGKQAVTTDYFLAICDLFGYEVTIE